MLETLAYSEFSQWVVASPRAYPTFLTLHGLGMAFVVGITIVTSLRVLGYPAQLPLAGYRRLLPLGIFAFVVNLASGTALFVADAVTMWENPSFQFKLVAILAGLVVLWRLYRGPLARAARSGATFHATGGERLLALAAIMLWGAAVIVSGRLIAYLAPALF